MSYTYVATQEDRPLEILLHDTHAGEKDEPIRQEGWARKVQKSRCGRRNDYEVLWLKLVNGEWVTLTGQDPAGALPASMEFKFMMRANINLLDPEDEEEDHPPTWWGNTGRN